VTGGDARSGTGGETRVDAHVKVLDDRVVARAKRRGLDAVVYAPHFTRLPAIRERAARFSGDGLFVVPGREVFTGDWRSRRHVLALGLSEPVPDFISLEGALAAFDRQDAAVLVPHPGFATVSLSAAAVRTHRDRLHAAEAYSAKLPRRWNDRAAEIVRESGLPAFGSSYAHLRGTVGEAWTAFRRRLDGPEAVVAAFREGVPRAVRRRRGRSHRLRRAAEFAHLGYENSWKKFDRVVRSGTEATHPDHPAYCGRFDDVAVY